VIVSATPQAGSTNQDTFGDLQFEFSEEVSAVNPSFLQVTSGGNPATGTLSCLTRSCSFRPDQPLAYLASTSATVTTAVTDLAGNPLAAPFSWSFTTRDRRWQPVRTITSSADHAEETDAAMTGDGQAFVSWLGAHGPPLQPVCL
jgi:hypothetical protein